jgi:hypothetical protein
MTCTASLSLRALPAGARALRRPLAPLALALTAAAAVSALLPAPAASAVGVPRTFDRLTVAYDDGAGHARTYRITCGLRREDEPCAHLDFLGGPLPPVADGQACSMIYGGPQTARLSGSWNGRPVIETYRRTNGCEVARWHRMEPALPDPLRGQQMRPMAA